METKLTSLSRRYQAALKKHLGQGPRAGPRSADRFGRQALAIGLETLDLARIHEQAMMALAAPSTSAGATDGMITKAQAFFIEAVTPIEKTHQTALKSSVRLGELSRTLRHRTEELTAVNRQLKKEILDHQNSKKALEKSKQHSRLLLEQSHHMQEELRHLSRQILSAQEDERRRISRELHDEISQVLTGINLHLATLKKEITADTKDLKKKITRTQRLVEKSVLVVHRFAGQLRPPELDDLGIFSALHSYIMVFAKQTGLSIHFASFTEDKIEKLNSTKRTVLYRVAQEAIANVAKHAKASRVDLSLERIPGAIRMEVKDDGISFQVQNRRFTGKNKHLGLIGMRERVEMVGGCFTIESEQGKGTMIRADIPFANGTRA